MLFAPDILMSGVFFVPAGRRRKKNEGQILL